MAGATGLVGKQLCLALISKGYDIVVIVRDIEKAKNSLPRVNEYITWSDKKALKDAVSGAYAVINLSGAPIVVKRWTKAYKNILFDSRILTTRQLVHALQSVTTKPRVLIQGSAIGYYGIVPQNTPYTEGSPSGNDFLARLCVAWEHEAQKALRYGMRVVYVRTAIILDRHEGALPRMITPFRYLLGGPIASGKQYFPWIHIEDEVGIICFALENPSVTGAINAVSPEIVTNKEFAKILGHMLHRPAWFPVPGLLLKLLFGEAADVLTSGVVVSSEKIRRLGYHFIYPSLQKALEDMLSNQTSNM